MNRIYKCPIKCWICLGRGRIRAGKKVDQPCPNPYCPHAAPATPAPEEERDG